MDMVKNKVTGSKLELWNIFTVISKASVGVFSNLSSHSSASQYADFLHGCLNKMSNHTIDF